MPVSTRTRPAGVSTSRQLSAWSRRCCSSSCPHELSHRTRGAARRWRPRQIRKVPPGRGDAFAAAQLAAQWTSSVETHRPPRGVSAARRFRRARSRGGRPRLSAGAVPWYFEPARSCVRALHGARHAEEADLADPHAGVEGDRQVRHVLSSKGEVPFQPGRLIRREWMSRPRRPRLLLPSSGDEVGGITTPIHVWPRTKRRYEG